MSEYSLLLDLDGFTGKGLTEKQFCSLFAKCCICGTHMMRGTINWHQCADVLIDLTGDDKDSDKEN